MLSPSLCVLVAETEQPFLQKGKEPPCSFGESKKAVKGVHT